MYNKVIPNFGVASSFLRNNNFLLPVYKCATSTLQISLHMHGLPARGYCTESPSEVVNQKYQQLYEQKLQNYLQDPQNKIQFEKIKLEVQYVQSHLNRVPDKPLTASNWLHLLQTPKSSQRRSYLEFLWKVEKKEQNKVKRKALKNKIREDEPKEENVYQLHKNTLMHRIRDSTINHFYNSRLMNAMLYEPSVVFDLGYEQFMTPNERQNCARQLLFSFSLNRSHDDPFNLYFCNANRNSPLLWTLNKSIPQLFDIDFPLNITSKSYLELFDRKQLVYLTPHTNNVMEKFDPNLVYIIGAMVDKTYAKPLSFQKARREGITMMRFPLSEKLNWGTGSTKNLPLNHVLPILLDLRHTNDWAKALQHVPRRKLQEARINSMQRQILFRERRIKKLTSD